MIIALTGTPGTGKTTVAEKLLEMEYQVIEINKFLQQKNICTEYNKKNDTLEIDTGLLEKEIQDHLVKIKKPNHVIIEGHLSHNLSFLDKIIVLRCHPKKLESRLKNKEFANAKVQENVEAETIDVITIESVELHGKDKVFEIDVTDKDEGQVINDVINIINNENSVQDQYMVGNIDWSEVILEWY
jgi:adenylate kinase